MVKAMGTAGEIIVHVDNVSFTYPPPERTKALKDVSFKVRRGEVVALIGQNGSGKTTLARCISGFLKPNKGEGTIRVAGEDIHTIPPHRQAQYVGYVFQNPDHQLFKDSVWDDVAFGLQNLQAPPDVLEERVEGMLVDLDLLQHRHLHPHRLAKGDKQRLAVAGIVIMEPPVIIVDEPTTGQDPQRARDIMRLLSKLNRDKGTTIIVITHAMDLVAEYAERVVVLCQGEMILDGPVRDVFEQTELLKQTYIEPPPIVQLGLILGLHPLPLTIAEARDTISQDIHR
jgi:energy-coupling factor transport system ATP-binding protein